MDQETIVTTVVEGESCIQIAFWPELYQASDLSNEALPTWEEIVMTELIPFCEARKLSYTFGDISSGSFAIFDERYWAAEDEERD